MDKIALMGKILRGEITHEPTYMEKFNNEKYYFTGEYIPGAFKKKPDEGGFVRNTVYVENKKGYSCIFLWDHVTSEMEKRTSNLEGIMSGICHLYTPDGRVFSDMSIRSNAGFKQDIFVESVHAMGSSIAHIVVADDLLASTFNIDDGKIFNLIDCGVSFPGTRKGRNKI